MSIKFKNMENIQDKLRALLGFNITYKEYQNMLKEYNDFEMPLSQRIEILKCDHLQLVKFSEFIIKSKNS